MAEVYWAARDLSSFVWGNHQFILVFLDASEAMPGLKVYEEGGKKFFTLAGHQPNGNLVYVPNQTDDIASVRESINTSLRGFFRDFDLEKHSVSAPTGSGLSFAFQLKQFADKYDANVQTNPVKYSLQDRNCSTWVNTLLKVAGVSLSTRRSAGEFRGIDWGEEELLDENLFR
jgi:hypothetical protein